MSCLRVSLRAKLRRMNSSLLKGNVGFAVACAVFAASPGWAEDDAARSTQDLRRFGNAGLDGPVDAAAQAAGNGNHNAQPGAPARERQAAPAPKPEQGRGDSFLTRLGRKLRALVTGG